MKFHLDILYFLVLFQWIPLSVDGQDTLKTLDIFDASNHLWENLKLWQRESPQIPDNPALSDFDFREIFLHYDYQLNEISPDTLLLEAQLVPYMGLLTTKLSFQVLINQGNIQSIDFISPIFKRNGKVLLHDDSLAIKVNGGEIISSSFIDILDNRIHQFRTLALPIIFRPPVKLDTLRSKLYYHSNDVDSLCFATYNHLLGVLYYIASGMQVYAGPVKISYIEKNIDLVFYIVLTIDNAVGHHFLLIEELYSYTNTHIIPIRAIVHFYPYIRLDNLQSLFGDFTDDIVLPRQNRNPAKIN